MQETKRDYLMRSPRKYIYIYTYTKETHTMSLPNLLSPQPPYTRLFHLIPSSLAAARAG